MKQQSACFSESMSIEEIVVQQISRDGEFHTWLKKKRKIITIAAVMLLGTGANAQPVLVGGFTGMAAVNGNSYTKTGVVGNPAGGYAFVAASNDRTKFYATWASNQYLYFIDPVTYAVTDSMSHQLYAIKASNEPNTIFARINTGICRINTVSKTITDSIAITNAFEIAERPNSKELWVGADNKIEVVNYAAGLLSVPFTYSNNTGDGGEIKFTAGGTIAYKMAWTSKKVYKINAITKAIIDSAICATAPSNITVSGDSSKLFVTFPNDKKIRIYQTSDMTVTDSIDCGTREPFDIYRHPDRAELWVVNHFDDTITVFNEATYAQIATIPVTSSPHAIAFATGTAGVDNPRQTVLVTAYPNPTTGSITISGLCNNDHIRVFDINGRELFELLAVGTRQTFNISALISGTYTIQVNDAAGRFKARHPITKL